MYHDVDVYTLVQHCVHYLFLLVSTCTTWCPGIQVKVHLCNVACTYTTQCALVRTSVQLLRVTQHTLVWHSIHLADLAIHPGGVALLRAARPLLSGGTDPEFSPLRAAVISEWDKYSGPAISRELLVLPGEEYRSTMYAAMSEGNAPQRARTLPQLLHFRFKTYSYIC